MALYQLVGKKTVEVIYNVESESPREALTAYKRASNPNLDFPCEEGELLSSEEPYIVLDEDGTETKVEDLEAQRDRLLDALANLADNHHDLQKQGDPDANPAPYIELMQLVQSDSLDESKLTPAQADALTIAREEASDAE